MVTFLPHVALLFSHLVIKDAACGTADKKREVITARLGEELTLDCIYNCSSGFIRGIWKFENMPVCSTCSWSVIEKNITEDMCIVSWRTLNLTLEQTLYNYSCYSIKSDHQELPQYLERHISLQIQDTTVDTTVVPRKEEVPIKMEIHQNQKKLSLSSHSIQVPAGDKLKLECLSSNQLCEGQWMRDSANPTEIISGPLVEWNEITEEDEGTYTCHTNQLCTSHSITVVIGVIKKDEFEWIKPLAAIAVSVAVMLLFLLIYLCYKKRGKNLLDEEDSAVVIYENTRSKNEEIHKPIAQDCQSDHEVPYADIVISVRGSSIPDLSGLHSQTPRDHRLKWREETSGASHLQACHSADRLHVYPREVSRKLSTTSEYAVITYSTDAIN